MNSIARFVVVVSNILLDFIIPIIGGFADIVGPGFEIQDRHANFGEFKMI